MLTTTRLEMRFLEVRCFSKYNQYLNINKQTKQPRLNNNNNNNNNNKNIATAIAKSEEAFRTTILSNNFTPTYQTSSSNYGNKQNMQDRTNHLILDNP